MASMRCSLLIAGCECNAHCITIKITRFGARIARSARKRASQKTLHALFERRKIKIEENDKNRDAFTFPLRAGRSVYGMEREE